MSQGIVKEIFKTRINSIITDKVLTDQKDIEARNACLKELLEKMVNKFPNCKISLQDADLFIYEHGHSIEKYIITLFGGQGKDSKCITFYIPI